MLLDRVDIDSHGPLTRVGLGPFSQQLNAIFAPAGAGKTALVRFLRDSLTGTTPAYQGMARSSGRVVWAAADGLYHCRREPNGTAEGRRFVEFESRLASQSQNRWNRPSLVVDLPASIVDGIVTDTTVTSPQRVVEAVLRSGLDRSGATAAEQARQHEIAALRRELERLRGLLSQDSLLPQDLDTESIPQESRIRDRLAALTLELGAIDSRREFARQSEAALQRARRDREAMSQAVAEVDRLRAQETELRSRLDALDRTLCRLQEQSKQDEQRIALTERTRTRVHWLNQQIERLRCLLGEVRELGDQWFGGHVPAQSHRLASSLAFDSRGDRGPTERPAPPLSRSELQLTDRGWSRKSASEPAAEPALVSRPAIGQRLDAACQLVDHLIGRLDAEQEHWLRLEYPLTERIHEQASESEQALERLRSGASATGGASPSGGAADLYQRLLADPGWVDDPLRRRRIDALRRAEQRRRLDEAADHEVIDGQPEDALLVTLRTIGEALHSVARRLRGLRGQWQYQEPKHASWSESWGEEAWQLTASAVPSSVPALPLAEQVDALRRCERDLAQTLERLAQHRVALLRRVAQAQRLPESLLDAMIADASLLPSAVDQWLVTSLTDGETVLDQRDRTERHGAELHGTQGNAGGTAGAESRLAQQQRLAEQRRQLARELEQTIQRIDARLADAERLRAGLKHLPLPNIDSDQAQRERIEAEIQHLHRLLVAPAAPSAAHRYRQCELRLQTLQAEQAAAMSLATAASERLRRLSGGRLASVTWRSQIDPASGRRSVEVLIDAQPERSRSDWDRSLAALAIRMAAADELTRRARPLPLVIEMPQRLGLAPQTLTSTAAVAFDQPSAMGTLVSQDLIADFVAALADAARQGRQIILLSDSRSLVDAANEFGGCGFDLRRTGEAPRFSVPHSSQVRPAESESAWTAAAKPQFATTAQELAAHDHVAPAAAAAVAAAVFDRPVGHDAGQHAAVQHDDAAADHQPLPNRRAAEPQPLPLARPLAPTAANGSQPECSLSDHDLPPRDLRERQDVVSFPIHAPAMRNGRGGGKPSPFFLTAESAIEQAPSIDVMAAIRLRELGIQTVAHLLACSPQELAQRIKLVDVDAATVRRWRNECRLVCGVAGLRGFDARVLVGCGIVHPQEVAEIHPAELVEKVEAFLATPRGVQILRTGSSHEVARLTGWIAEARRSSRSGPSVVTGKTLRASGRPAADAPRQPERETAAEPVKSEREPALKFYLQRQSPIVDAPSIGPRMAERLAKLQITTVDDLLAAKPAEVAAGLKLRRVDAAVVRAWQQQIQLVCRVPLLRGHDAQLLVAAGIHEPERLAQCDPQWLLSQINPISRSREGQRILRGSQPPDLAEVTQWVRWAQQHRELQAA